MVLSGFAPPGWSMNPAPRIVRMRIAVVMIINLVDYMKIEMC
jgi:hypothetical protein